ncbi:MAG: hypothetical protein FJX65_15625 [Alphaproteobacteria bacterium]|nr:hypothetical protein [Alphaproteobacteria bacterium]
MKLAGVSIHKSIIEYRGFFYLKLAAGLVLLSVAAYWVHQPLAGPNGGTWLGYTLGTIGALLIVWLAWFGIRKRRYGVGRLLLEDWLSGHIYLGVALLIIATLHSGFQFGWNVHTLAYVLMVGVIVSGAFGLLVYLRVPALRTENRQNMSLDDMMALIAGLSKEIYQAASTLDDEVGQLVQEADQRTRIGGGFWRQLSGTDPHCATTRALNKVRARAEQFSGADADAARQLVTLLARKVELLARARRDVRHHALLKVWLYFHVPMTVGLIAALLIHIFVVFLYW